MRYQEILAHIGALRRDEVKAVFPCSMIFFGLMLRSIAAPLALRCVSKHAIAEREISSFETPARQGRASSSG